VESLTGDSGPGEACPEAARERVRGELAEGRSPATGLGAVEHPLAATRSDEDGTKRGEARQEESESASGEGTQEACCAATACECWRTWRGGDEKGIVIVVVVIVVVVVEQKQGILPNKSSRPAATKVEEAQGKRTRDNPTLGTNISSQPNEQPWPRARQNSQKNRKKQTKRCKI